MTDYIKHLIECKCILPQFRNMPNPPWHKFVVFSVLDDKGNVKPSYVQCENCNAIHNVIEVGISKILNKDSMLTIPTIEDIKTNVPDWLAVLLERHSCTLPTWQEAKFIIENKLWGRTIILAKERDGEKIIGKYVTIFGENLYKIDTFEMNDTFINV